MSLILRKLKKKNRQSYSKPTRKVKKTKQKRHVKKKNFSLDIIFSLGNFYLFVYFEDLHSRAVKAR